MKPTYISLISFAVITLCGCSSPQQKPVRPSSQSQAVPETPTRPEDAKLLQALELCAPAQDKQIEFTARNYSTANELREFMWPQLTATSFSIALARTVEKATTLGTNISVQLMNPLGHNLGRIQEILGKEDSKYDADLNETPNAIRPVPVTWYRYGWGEFAIRNDVVVSVRGKTDCFRRKE